MLKVLFVDDEPRVLDGLRRALRKQREDWDMHFVTSAREAVDKFEQVPFDVVVSDVRMPGMDGPTLLRHVREEHPDAVRIVLSGQMEEVQALRAAQVAHQFLAKPCDTEELIRLVRRLVDLQSRLRSPAIRRMVTHLESLPGAPRTFLTLTTALTDPDVDLDHVARIVEEDGSVAAKVLQLVNSAFFGLSRKTTSVREAVAYLGLDPLRGVVLAAEVAKAYEDESPVRARFSDRQQKHGLFVARMSQHVLAGRPTSVDAFAAGLLHDIGRLVLLRAVESPPDLPYDQLLAEQAKQEAELGVTHAEVGAALLGLWGLPATVSEAVALHHDPMRFDAGFSLAAGVHIADVLSHEHEGRESEFDPELLASVGVLEDVDRWRRKAAAIAEDVYG